MRKILLVLFLLFSSILIGCDSNKEKDTPTLDIVTPENNINTIDDIIDTEFNKDIITLGKVIAKNEQGFIIKDNTNAIFVNYSETINQISINKTYIIHGKHIYDNGHKIALTKAKTTSEISAHFLPILIDDEDIANYISSFELNAHLLKNIVLNAKIITENNDYVLKTEKYTIK